MGYRLNRVDEPVFMADPKPLRTEFGIHLRLESCESGLVVGHSLVYPLISVDTVK